MDGVKCNEMGCGVCDFLPFRCPICQNCYCLSHRSRFNHNCLSDEALNEDEKISNDTESAESLASVHSQMMENIENRHSSLTAGSTKEHYKINYSKNEKNISVTDSVVNKIEKMDKLLAKTDKSSKSFNTINKTKQILISTKAKGNNNIAVADRFFLVFKLKENSNIVNYYYFSQHSTIAEILNLIANEYPLIYFGHAIRPVDKTLALATDIITDWQLLNRNSQLKSSELIPFQTVYITVVDISEMITSQ